MDLYFDNAFPNSRLLQIFKVQSFSCPFWRIITKLYFRAKIYQNIHKR